jgi:thiol-disulfide isomerase/thioredoxin
VKSPRARPDASASGFLRLSAWGPWIATIAAAVIFGLSAGGGCALIHAENRPLPPLTASVMGSQELISNRTLLGKPAILNVWSPSCVPCRLELPGLDELAEKYAGRVTVMGLLAWGTPGQAAAFAKSKGLTHLPIALGADHFVESMGVDAVPTTFFVRADGTLVGRLTGAAPEWLFKRQAEKLLAATP